MKRDTSSAPSLGVYHDTSNYRVSLSVAWDCCCFSIQENSDCTI